MGFSALELSRGTGIPLDSVNNHLYGRKYPKPEYLDAYVIFTQNETNHNDFLKARRQKKAEKDVK